MTVGEMIGSLTTWLHEDASQQLLTEAISDSITSLWETVVLINLSEALGGPVQASFSPASDHADVVSIVDPTAPALLGQVAQGALAEHEITAQYTYVTDSGSETLPSPEQVLLIAANNLALVGSPARQPNAVGWNCYFGGVKQNDTPIEFNVSYTELETGAAEDGDRLPTENTTGDDIWYIQELYVQTPTGETALTETEIGSALWRKFANAQATASPYQNYCYDFDGRKVQVRPLAGQGFNANYFYVRRPRAVKYEASVIPFRHPAAEVFIRYNALSLVSLSNHEYEASGRWEARAEKERLLIMQSLAKKNNKKHQYIRPVFR